MDMTYLVLVSVLGLVIVGSTLGSVIINLRKKWAKHH